MKVKYYSDSPATWKPCSAGVPHHGTVAIEYAGGCHDILVDKCAWVPFSRIWPLACIALMTFAAIIAVCHLAAGNYHALVPCLGLLMLLAVFGPWRVLKHGLVSIPGGFIQPETAREATYFAACHTVTVRTLLGKAWQNR